MQRMVLGAAAALALTGCASVMNDTTQPMKIETRNDKGDLVSGAECNVTNDYGTTAVKSGVTSQVRRSGKDLDIVCKDPQHPDAIGRGISRANAGLAGNIIFGSGIGAIIDHNKGTAYTYPTWVQLVFGQTLVFDRSAEKEGAPVIGTAPAAVAKAP
ncbi:hypothetical protein C8246_15215 [Paracidovorax avenae]|uniref:hypothetical protein n=1 Tax=Paracidovorax avenae TaxID=80867 RepID=UPI000D17CB05|nr:hypothetical protein [Paracidovorax avenae]AVS79681.1 hypothetical protein C8237_00195 [Paracidovorax avenae]AVS92921.1 hypothetical protein C8246_15215 [Paracidovorax avenae]AVS97397.1 hypothetical protein C8236_00180 [Paracidovorax avenae]AVT04574.1 hypothetical protein C8248_00175 [Paracidovorax avenae]AVT14797.1 hypothetical protein C8244_00195 [Paracidovorax avenae]